MFLTLCFAQILEGVGQLVADLVAHHPRDAEAAGIRQGFQAGRDIDAVAEDVVAVDDDVAEVDPDPEPDPAVLRHAGFAVDHRPLHLGGTADGVDDARELDQHPVASRLDDTAGMLADLRVNELAAMRLQAFVRALLVRAHQARVAGHISGQDRGETADSGHRLRGGQFFNKFTVKLSKAPVLCVARPPLLDSRTTTFNRHRRRIPAARCAIIWPSSPVRSTLRSA
jgi:hypothetical protein